MLGVIIALTVGFNYKDLKHGSLLPTELIGPIIGGIIFFFVGLAVIWNWFQFSLLKYVWNNSRFLNSKFICDINFFPYLRLVIGNMFLLIFSIGFLWPLVAVRNIKFLLNHLTLTGNLNLEEITQDIRTTSATGESIADFMDIGSGIDLGI